MKHIAIIASLILGLLFSPIGISQPYFGVGAGFVSIDEESQSVVSLGNVVEGVDDEAFTATLYGGYQINDHFSLELSYLKSGALNYEVTLNEVEGEEDLYIEAWTPAVHIHKDFGKASIFGFLGMAFWEVRLNDKGLGVNDEDSDISFGLGAEFAPSDSWAVRGQWRRIDADGDYMEGEADFFLLGVHRHF